MKRRSFIQLVSRRKEALLIIRLIEKYSDNKNNLDYYK